MQPNMTYGVCGIPEAEVDPAPKGIKQQSGTGDINSKLAQWRWLFGTVLVTSLL